MIFCTACKLWKLPMPSQLTAEFPARRFSKVSNSFPRRPGEILNNFRSPPIFYGAFRASSTGLWILGSWAFYKYYTGIVESSPKLRQTVKANWLQPRELSRMPCMHLSGRALFTRPLLYHAFSCSPRRQFPDGAPLSAAVSVYEPPPRYAPSSLLVSLADGRVRRRALA